METKSWRKDTEEDRGGEGETREGRIRKMRWRESIGGLMREGSTCWWARREEGRKRNGGGRTTRECISKD